MRRRSFCLAAPIAFGAPLAGRAQTPDAARPIKIVVATPGRGGLLDTSGKVVAARLSRDLRRPVSTELMPPTDAVQAMVRAPADGSTLLLANQLPLSNQVLKNEPYDLGQQLTAVAWLHRSPLVLYGAPGTSTLGIAGFLEQAKSTQQPVLVVATQPVARVAALQLGQKTGLNIEFVAAQTPLASFEALKAKRVHLVIANPISGEPSFRSAGDVSGQPQGVVNSSSALAFVKGGFGDALAMTGERRSPALSDLPTMGESGIAGYVHYTWSGIFGPAGMEASLVASLNAAMNATTDGVALGLSLSGTYPEFPRTTAARFAAVVQSEIQTMTEFHRSGKLPS